MRSIHGRGPAIRPRINIILGRNECGGAGCKGGVGETVRFSSRFGLL